MSLFGSPTSGLLGGFSTTSSLGATGSGIPPVGTNPIDPLAGQPAVAGIGQFIQSVQQTAALRKAGLLPPTGQPSAAGAPGAGGAPDLQTLLSSLMQQMAALSGTSPAGGATSQDASAGFDMLA